MAVGEDDDDYIRYGTPLVQEEEMGRKKGKLAVEQGQVRRVAPWQQEVTDSEGRRRFHGAFTGGFSAGYYNSVGSKEGWTPTAFVSSRKQRAGKKEQQVYDFLDEDEKEELKSKEVVSSIEFDTFGSTAADIARRAAQKEVERHPTAIPGPIADEIVVPSTQSIGVKLLIKMGWREGRGIGPDCIALASDAQRRGRKASLALATSSQIDGADLPSPVAKIDDENDGIGEEDEENAVKTLRPTPLYVSHPKTDLHGLGFDVYRNAPEFRASKLAKDGKQSKGQILFPRKGSVRTTERRSLFGSNAFEMGTDLEFDDVEDLDYEIGEPDGVAAVGDRGDKFIKRSTLGVVISREDCLPGFNAAVHSSTQVQSQRFPAPVIPAEFTAKHVMQTRQDAEQHLSRPEPPEVPPPDPQTTKAIEGLAAVVARSGKRFEDMLKDKHTGNPQFGFLFGGSGHDYYLRKLWEKQRAFAMQGKEPIYSQSESEEAGLVGSERGRILGETPLATESAPNAMVTFEGWSELTAQMNTRFTSGATDTKLVPEQRTQLDSGLQHPSSERDLLKYPTREECFWRPTALLCKRFNVVDPCIGKNESLLQVKSGIESSGNLWGSGAQPLSLTLAQSSTAVAGGRAFMKKKSPEPAPEDIEEVDVMPDNAIDLYKAIFSDDEDDEENQPVGIVDERVGYHGRANKQSEAAHAALNRLAAGDFLESLGKELGLKVATDLAHQ